MLGWVLYRILRSYCLVFVIQEETERAKRFLRKEMGLDLGRAEANVPINFTKDEINQYVKRFKSLDIDNKGYITVNDLRRYFKVSSL